MSSNPSALYTPQDIKGWTALVTGASSGFGKALCGNQPVRRVHFFTNAAVMTESSGERPTPPRHAIELVPHRWRAKCSEI